MEGGEPVAVLHVDGEFHGSLGGRGAVSRGDRSDTAESDPVDGAADAVRGVEALP